MPDTAAYDLMRGFTHGLAVQRRPVVPRSELVMAMLDVASELSHNLKLLPERRLLLAAKARDVYVALARGLTDDERARFDLATAEALR